MDKHSPPRLEDVFTIYQTPLEAHIQPVRRRFDEEFVRVLSEKKIGKTNLARQIFVSWSKLNSLTTDSKSLEWMTVDTLLAMNALSFDIDYILKGERKVDLTRAEAALVDNYRHASESDQNALQKIVIALAKPEEDMKDDAA